MTCLVKICGITNLGDAQAAIAERADMLGFIFVAASPRSITLEDAKSLIKKLPRTVKLVGVFQNEDAQIVNETALLLQLDYVQLHGKESVEYCSKINTPIIKVLELDGEDSCFEEFADNCAKYGSVAEIILVDRPKTAIKSGSDWLEATVKFLESTKNSQLPLMVAGGLNSENIRYVIDRVTPFGVDCASGTETSPGFKDHLKLKRFMTAVKGELVS